MQVTLCCLPKTLQWPAIYCCFSVPVPPSWVVIGHWDSVTPLPACFLGFTIRRLAGVWKVREGSSVVSCVYTSSRQRQLPLHSPASLGILSTRDAAPLGGTSFRVGHPGWRECHRHHLLAQWPGLLLI